MCRVPVLPLAIAILASLLLSSRATLPVDWADAEAWYDSLGFPDTRELPYVRVATGLWSRSGAEPEENTFVEGFVVHEDPSAFTVFICSASYFDDSVWPLEPHPALTTARFVPGMSGPAHQRVGYEVLDFKVVAADVLERVRAQASTPHGGLQWGRRVSHRVRIFAFARACLQRADLLETGSALMNLAANIPDEQTGKVDPRMFTSTLQRQLGDAVLTEAETQFANPAISWAELLKPYEEFAVRFPANRKLAYAKESAEVLRSMIAEEASHHPEPVEQMTPAKEIAENIYQLRNIGHCRWIMNSQYPIDARTRAGPDVITPVHRLVDLGFDAVPQLITALEDRRFTRCMFQFHNMRAEPRIMRVGDFAQRILEHMSGRNFSRPRAHDGRPIGGTTRQEAEAWWADVQSKGEKQLLIEAAVAGGDAGCKAARKLVAKYPDMALGAIDAGFHATINEGTQAQFVKVASLLPGDSALIFLRSKLAPGTGVYSQVEAAKALFARGELEPVPAMIAAWGRIQPRLATNANDAYSEVGRLITFLAKSGNVEAVNALALYMRNAPIDVRLGIVRVFGPPHKSGGTSANGKSVHVDAYISVLPGGAAGRAIERLLITALTDTERRIDMTGHYDEAAYKDPRICDMAALILSKRWPDKYRFRWVESVAECDAQIANLRKPVAPRLVKQ